MDKTFQKVELELQFNLRKKVPEFQEYFDRWDYLSRQTEKTHQVTNDLSYGDHPRQKLDIYPAQQKNAKTLVFIHGGYWKSLDKSDFQFVAQAFNHYGITIALITYPLAPEVKIDTIISSCQMAMLWLFNNIAAYNGNPLDMTIAGHSAGAHLSAKMLTTKWSDRDSSLPDSLFSGCLLLSGLYDLVPVRHSYLNEELGLDTASAINNSVIHELPIADVPIEIVVGADETEEFIDQSKRLFESWKPTMKSVHFSSLNNIDHFSIMDSLLDPNSALHRKFIKVFGIKE